MDFHSPPTLHRNLVGMVALVAKLKLLFAFLLAMAGGGRLLAIETSNTKELCDVRCNDEKKKICEAEADEGGEEEVQEEKRREEKETGPCLVCPESRQEHSRSRLLFMLPRGASGVRFRHPDGQATHGIDASISAE